VLPVSDSPIDPRRNASPACWDLYMMVVGHELAHVPQLGSLHQLTVDAYAAQHAGPQAPAIGVAFALIGLLLALDEGWTGGAVRAAHQHLAADHLDLPQFTPPSVPAPLTIAHVAGSRGPQAHARRVHKWAASVWHAWSTEHARVLELADRTLTDAVRARLRSA